MTSSEWAAYAAGWGSYIRNGDPGACMYGFRVRPNRGDPRYGEDTLYVQSEEHRQDCLAWIEEQCIPIVERDPAHYASDELENLRALSDAIRYAPISPD